MNSPSLSPFAGKYPGPADLIDIPKLVQAYETDQPDPSVPAQRVVFGTSGHRGSSLDLSFNRNHIQAITQSICIYRSKANVTGPLFIGLDTHALSGPAFQTALEVLAANNIETFIAKDNGFTPTPVISHAILAYNKNRTSGLADGIVITPSHNPPRDGGFKYNPSHGGPAEEKITNWIQNNSNDFLTNHLNGVKQVPVEMALSAPTTHPYDFQTPYIDDLENVLDMKPIAESKLKMCVDALGGAGVHYWGAIAERYGLNLTVLHDKVDPTFKFMTRDWDGQIRMDPSSRYAMGSLMAEAPNYDISFACDTDHDRHGIVTHSAGLMAANEYLSVMVNYLFKNRPHWPTKLKIGKTLVSSQMIDRVAATLQRAVYEVPVGFKWFVEGLSNGNLGFAGEESAGATFLKKDGSVWTTDKDGIVPALLSAEITARMGHDPGVAYQNLTRTLGKPLYKRVDFPAAQKLREKIKNLNENEIPLKKLAGDEIQKILLRAPGNQAPIGGVKLETKNGWIALRPSGTEDIYKIYGESFVSEKHLETLFEDGNKIVQCISGASEGKNCLNESTRSPSNTPRPI